MEPGLPDRFIYHHFDRFNHEKQSSLNLGAMKFDKRPGMVIKEVKQNGISIQGILGVKSRGKGSPGYQGVIYGPTTNNRLIAPSDLALIDASGDSWLPSSKASKANYPIFQTEKKQKKKANFLLDEPSNKQAAYHV